MVLPGLSLRSNPGLKLANAFGVTGPELANAFGVTELKLANAFGVTELKLANAYFKLNQYSFVALIAHSAALMLS